MDFRAEAVALARAVRRGRGTTRRAHAALLQRAAESVWGRSRDHQQSATSRRLFAEAGLDHDPELLVAYDEFWEPHTRTDPEVAPVWRRCASAASGSACSPTRSGRASGTAGSSPVTACSTCRR